MYIQVVDENGKEIMGLSYPMDVNDCLEELDIIQDCMCEMNTEFRGATKENKDIDLFIYPELGYGLDMVEVNEIIKMLNSHLIINYEND